MPDPWSAVEALAARSLDALFEAESDRVARLSVEESGIRFDFSKTHLDAAAVRAFAALAQAQDLAGAREALFAGRIVNPTEGRAAEHSALRGIGKDASVEEAHALRDRMELLVNAIHEGALGEVKHLIHIGIGGSALGPALAVDALTRDLANVDVLVVSNIDGQGLEAAF